MPINFPTSLDSLTNPASSDQMNVVPHASQHANANDILEALEAKVGIDSSVVTTSHDYKLSGVTSTAKALSSGLNLSDLASVATARTNLGLGTIVTINVHANLVTPLASAPTGTGVVVLATSPVLTTPSLGVASATSLALGGGTISTRALMATAAATEVARFHNTASQAAQIVVQSSDRSGTLACHGFGNGFQVTGGRLGIASDNATFDYYNINGTVLYGVIRGSTVTGAGNLFFDNNLLFTDNTYDIGASGATRPRTGYFGTSVVSPKLQGGGVTDSFGMIDWSGTRGRSSLAGGGGRAPWDFAGGTVSGHLLFTDNTYDIGASGATRPRNLYLANDIFCDAIFAGGNINAGAASFLYWDSRSLMGSPANGQIALYNFAGTDFSRLMFGGTTSSFPAWKRSGTGLIARLADDSADTTLQCAALTATTGTFTGQQLVTLTTQQALWRYDASNHLGLTVASDGGSTFAITGSANGGFTFTPDGSGLVTISSGGLAITSGNLELTTGDVTLYDGDFSIGGVLTTNPQTATTSGVDVVNTTILQSSGTVANGFGAAAAFYLETDSNPSRIASQAATLWATAADGTRKARVIHYAYDTSARECLRLEASGTAPMIGFLGAAAVARPAAYTPTNVSADRSYDADTVLVAELADVVGTLISDLQSLGLIG